MIITNSTNLNRSNQLNNSLSQITKKCFALFLHKKNPIFPARRAFRLHKTHQ